MSPVTLALIVACMSPGCARYTEGTAVADHELPRDVRQLVEWAVAAVPLTVQKMEGMPGTPMEEGPQTPKRFDGGPVHRVLWVLSGPGGPGQR
jgi:hypothetical protein